MLFIFRDIKVYFPYLCVSVSLERGLGRLTTARAPGFESRDPSRAISPSLLPHLAFSSNMADGSTSAKLFLIFLEVTGHDDCVGTLPLASRDPLPVYMETMPWLPLKHYEVAHETTGTFSDMETRPRVPLGLPLVFFLIRPPFPYIFCADVIALCSVPGLARKPGYINAYYYKYQLKYLYAA